jgi:hypothetical protein
MAESELNPGKSPSSAVQSGARAEELAKALEVLLPVLPRELALQVLAEFSLLEIGPEKWRLCGTGVSTVDLVTEQEAQPNGPHKQSQS